MPFERPTPLTPPQERDKTIKSLEKINAIIAQNEALLREKGKDPEKAAEAVKKWLEAQSKLREAENDYNNAVVDVFHLIREQEEPLDVERYQVETPVLPTSGEPVFQYGLGVEKRKRLEEELRTGRKSDSEDLPVELL